MRSRALLLLLSCCTQTAPPPRAPTAAEMGAESVVDNYAPQRLRLFSDRPGPGEGRAPRTLILASERPELPASFRPLGVSERAPPEDFVPRASTFTWVDGHVVADPIAAPKDARAATPAKGTILLIYGRDGYLKQRREVPLQGPCTPSAPVLLQPFRQRLYALLRCRAEDRALLLSMTAEGDVSATVMVAGGAETELFLHDGESTYLLGGRRVMRVGLEGQKTIGTVPPPGGGVETRDMLRHGDELWIIDGAMGRVIRMDARQMSWRAEQHFPVGQTVTRLRAVFSGDHLMVVLAQRSGGDRTELYGLALPVLAAGPAGRLLLLSVDPLQSDHELLPVDGAQGGGALLCRTHQGNSGPLVALTRLHF